MHNNYSSTRSNRESWIDVCKGIAIILVVIGHVKTSYINSDLLNNAYVFNSIGTIIYSFHMPLFFLISGYLFSCSSKKKCSFDIFKICISYGIPYIAFSVVLWFSKIIFSNLVNDTFSVTDLLKILIFPLSYLWFLYALLIIEIAQTIVSKVSKSAASKFIIVIALFILRFVLIIFISDNSYIYDLGIVYAGKYYIYFVLGEYCISFLVLYLNKLSILRFSLFITFVCFALYCFLILRCLNHILSNPIISFVLAIIGSILMLFISRKINKCKLLELIGKNTMPIYLFHGFIISACRIILQKLNVPLFLGFVPILICSCAGVFLSLFLYFIIHRIPVFDFFIYPKKYLLNHGFVTDRRNNERL